MSIRQEEAVEGSLGHNRKHVILVKLDNKRTAEINASKRRAIIKKNESQAYLDLTLSKFTDLCNFLFIFLHLGCTCCKKSHLGDLNLLICICKALSIRYLGSK
jgi:hypothetical protein